MLERATSVALFVCKDINKHKNIDENEKSISKNILLGNMEGRMSGGGMVLPSVWVYKERFIRLVLVAVVRDEYLNCACLIKNSAKWLIDYIKNEEIFI